MRIIVVCLAIMLGCCRLASADLVFVGFNADSGDEFAIGLLTDHAAGTVFRFRDDEWNGSSFNTGEGSFSFTNTAPLAAGTVLVFRDLSLTTKLVATGAGAAVPGTFSSGALALGNSDEAIYAYFGPDFNTVTTPLASIRTDSTSEILFGNVVDFDNLAQQDGDVLAYAGPTTAAAFANFAALTSNESNWTLQGDGGGDQGASFSPPIVLAIVPEASSLLFGAIACITAGAVVAVRRYA